MHVIIGLRILREKRRISISVTSFLNGGGVVIDRTHRMYFFDNSKEGGKKLPVSEICAPFNSLLLLKMAINNENWPSNSVMLRRDEFGFFELY